MRAFTSYGIGVVVLFLLLTVAGCGEQAARIERFSYSIEAVYSEPPDSEDPVLIFARDLIFLGGRLYVLDGRLAHVAVFEPRSGEHLFTFGGLGEGPGELGLYPYGLVTDGDRIGVAHLFQVSWFTPGGEFLERVLIPPLDLATPSLQYSQGGWMFNASFRGEGSPVARYVSSSGDTTGFGGAVESEHPDAVGLATMELNAVHICRFQNGNVILGWVHENRIETYSPSGELIAVDEWTHFPRKPERRPDGRIRFFPGFSFSAALGADGYAYMLDGTLRVVRTYESGGGLLREHYLDRRVVDLAWVGPNLAYAIDGSDTVLRLKLLGEVSEQPELTAGGQTSAAAAPDSGEAAQPLPGEIVVMVEDLGELLQEHDIFREGRASMVDPRPRVMRVAGGENLLYVGYKDGQGLLLRVDEEGGWNVERVLPAHPRSSLRSNLLMAGDRPVLFDIENGLYPAEGTGGVEWPGGVWPSSALWLSDSRFLVHDSREQDADPLFTVDMDAGSRIEAGGGGSHRRPGLRFKPAYNWWHLLRWDEGKVLVFDESYVRLSWWEDGALSRWSEVTGSGLRPINERTRGRTPDNDMDGLLPLVGIGILVYRGDFVEGEVLNTVTLISTEGSTLGHWKIPVGRSVASMTLGPRGRIFFCTGNTLYEWRNLQEGLRALVGR